MENHTIKHGTLLIIRNFMKYSHIFFLMALTSSLNQTLPKELNLRPIPWITHEAFLLLDQYMNTHDHPNILEFGAGASTIWLSKRTKNLVSVEHNIKFFNLISEKLTNSPESFPVKHIFHKTPYYSVCDIFPNDYFDLIVIDGRNRKGCIKNAIRILKPNGILILDNAERPYYQGGKDLLSSWKVYSFIQNGPDSCNFTYPNWTTNCYVKP